MNRCALAIGLLIFLCQSTTGPATQEIAFTVLPSAQVTHLAGGLCSRDVPGHVSSGWDPTPTQVAQAEARLPGFVVKNRDKTRDRQPPKPFDQYVRQYLGVVIDDETFIYVNLFPRDIVESRARFGKEPDDWRSTFVVVCDGGASFWGVLFDPRTLRFFSPRFNGS